MTTERDDTPSGYLTGHRHVAAPREVGDPVADTLAAGLRAGHEDLDERDLVRLVLAALVTGPPGDHGPLGAWMRDGPPLPPWCDRDRVAAGQRFFAEWTLPICALLYCAALPNAYAAADGVQVLALTSDLATHNANRRIAETGQMLLDVMDLGRCSPDALAPGGQGYVTARGVRLLHAVVRQAVATSGQWQPAWGTPVNQEDLLGTLLTFTVAVFDGLDRLGVPYDRDGAEDYLHAWCVVGSLLGIDPCLLPLDRAAAEARRDELAARLQRPSEAGRWLMAVLLAEMDQAMPWGLRRLPRTLVRQAVTPAVADTVGVPPPAWWAPALALVARLGPTLGRLPGGRRLLRAPSELLGRAVMRMFVDKGLAGGHPPFRIDAGAATRLAIATSAWRARRRHRRYDARARRAARTGARGGAAATGRAAA